MIWLKEKLKKFKKWIIGFVIGGVVLAAGTQLLPQDISHKGMLQEYNQAPQIKQKYSLEGASFNLMVKDDWKDRIVVKVGNETGNFEPKLKIERWDDEVNFFVKLIDNETGNPKVSFKDEKIVWTKGNKEVNFYDLPIGVENPEGGYEFEVILKEKPATNKIEFSLNTKGLDFFYQPALTPEEIAQGVSRPENVVGSYAVYASEQKTNWEGGKLYKAGKVGHIFRPKIIDSAGKEIWGKLNIDKGILSIEIPQKFLDEAVYPVIVDPTFGYTGQGASQANPPQDYFYGGNGTPASSGTVTEITWFGNGNGYGGNFKGILVEATGKTIISNGITNAVAIANNATNVWHPATFATDPSVTSQEYFVSFITSLGTGLMYDSGVAGDKLLYDSTNSYTTPTNPTDGTVYTGSKYSIYATYTAGAAAASIESDLILFEE